MSTLSKKFLAGLGIDDDKADLICERHKEVLNEIITERDEFKEKAEKYDDAQTQLNKYKEAEKKAAESSEKDPYKVKYEAIKEEFENYKKEIADKEIKAKKTDAYKQLLKDAVYRPLLVEGLMQCGTTRVPTVRCERNFRRYAESALEAEFEGFDKIVAHPDAAGRSTCRQPSRKGCVIAVGPEGGWTDDEVNGLEEKGFRRYSLGSRILRTDTATIALIAQLMAVKDIW